MYVTAKSREKFVKFNIDVEFNFDSVKEKEKFKKSLNVLADECEGSELGDFLYMVYAAIPK